MDATQTRVAEILASQDLSKATLSAKSDTAGSVSRIAIGGLVTAEDLFDKTKLAIAATLSKGGQWQESNTGANNPVNGEGAGALYAVYNDVPLSLNDIAAIALSEQARRNALERAENARLAGIEASERRRQEALQAEFSEEVTDSEESRELDSVAN